MKNNIFISLLLIVCQNVILSQDVYINNLYCTSTLTLYDNGRADWYDCEVDETFYGHYWQKSDSLFIETFCSSIIHGDHQCFSPRLDIYIIKYDTLLNVGYNDIGYCSYYQDSICYFPYPFVYVRTLK